MDSLEMDITNETLVYQPGEFLQEKFVGNILNSNHKKYRALCGVTELI